MTGLESNIKGKAFYRTENGEYQELGELISIETEEQNEKKYKYITTNTEIEFEIKNKDIIRKFKQLIKTDKEKKAERRFNKDTFRKFIIKNKY